VYEWITGEGLRVHLHSFCYQAFVDSCCICTILLFHRLFIHSFIHSFIDPSIHSFSSRPYFAPALIHSIILHSCVHLAEPSKPCMCVCADRPHQGSGCTTSGPSGWSWRTRPQLPWSSCTATTWCTETSPPTICWSLISGKPRYMPKTHLNLLCALQSGYGCVIPL